VVTAAVTAAVTVADAICARGDGGHHYIFIASLTRFSAAREYVCSHLSIAGRNTGCSNACATSARTRAQPSSDIVWPSHRASTSSVPAGVSASIWYATHACSRASCAVLRPVCTTHRATSAFHAVDRAGTLSVRAAVHGSANAVACGAGRRRCDRGADTARRCVARCCATTSDAPASGDDSRRLLLVSARWRFVRAVAGGGASLSAARGRASLSAARGRASLSVVGGGASLSAAGGRAALPTACNTPNLGQHQPHTWRQAVRAYRRGCGASRGG
jgi:hypothetical protein